MDNQQIQHFIGKYKQGTITEAELKELDAWYRDAGYRDSVYPDEEELVKGRILARLNQQVAPAKKKKFWSMTAAAVLLITLSAGYFLSSDRFNNSIADITPGSNKAILTLASGKTITLTEIAQGKIGGEPGTSITKTKDGQVIYKADAEHKEESQAFSNRLNVLTTPRGGQYQVILPDGTRVWLNAASSIKFPSAFTGMTERRVDLNGEAYFEVAKDKAHPFIVDSKRQQIEVLGTHFNTSNYDDEGVTKTTLLEGSVKVSSSARQEIILKPGQQSTLSGTRLTVGTANTEQTVAWKNALFVFDHDNLESIMRKISRWYDVEVVYIDEEVKAEVFSGRISRFENVSEVLKKLTLTGAVQFKIERRRILVMK